MLGYNKTTASIALVAMLLSTSMAEDKNTMSKLEMKVKNNTVQTKDSLKDLADKVQHLSPKELNELGVLMGVDTEKKHVHKEVKPKPKASKEKVVSSKNKKNTSLSSEKKSKIKEILTALGGLAAKEGTDSACKFCSAILSDVMVNKVEVVDMAQDWVQLRIKKGDSLAKLSKKYYGNSQAFKMIANLNRDTLGKNNTIYAGKVITIPRAERIKDQSKEGKLSCKFCAALLADSSLNRIEILKHNKDSTEIKVKKGDMLSSLALRYYGKSSEYHKIYEANKEVIGENYLIFPGIVLKIPHTNEN